MGAVTPPLEQEATTTTPNSNRHTDKQRPQTNIMGQAFVAGHKAGTGPLGRVTRALGRINKTVDLELPAGQLEGLANKLEALTQDLPNMAVRVMHRNAQSIRHKKHELELFLKNNKVYIAAVTETMLPRGSALKLWGFYAYRSDGPEGRGG